MKMEYVGPNRERMWRPRPAKDVRYLKGPVAPHVMTGPTGKVKVLKPKKNPLDAWEIEGRAFSAQILPPGQSASGFFYFQTRPATRRHALYQRPLRSRHRQGTLLLRTPLAVTPNPPTTHVPQALSPANPTCEMYVGLQRSSPLAPFVPAQSPRPVHDRQGVGVDPRSKNYLFTCLPVYPSAPRYSCTNQRSHYAASRRSVRAPDPAQEPRLRGRRHPHHRPGNRRQHRHLQRHQRRPPAPSPLQESRPPGLRLGRHAQAQREGFLLLERRFPRPPQRLRLGLPGGRRGLHRTRHPAARGRRPRADPLRGGQ